MTSEALSVDGWRGWADYGGGFAETHAAYRYDLVRQWKDGVGSVVFCMLNPSTATAEQNDPTVRRCMGFARAWGFGQLRVVNLFALRSTDPRALRTTYAPEGDPYNLRAIVTAARGARLVVCAWGQHGRFNGRDRVVLEAMVRAGVKPHALKLGANGVPCHPLYLSSNLKPDPIWMTA